MEKEFVPYEQALALKELGFDEPCFAWFGPTGIFNDWDTTDTIAPLYEQAFRWFREKYDLDNAVLKNKYVIETQEDLPTWYYGFNTYEEAELACLIKLIEIVKKK